MATIEMTIKYTASEWSKDGSTHKRRWDRPGSPPDGHPDGNLAAQVEVKGSWPFKSYEWAVWGPFEEDAVLTGEEASAELAMEAADKAMRTLVAEAQKDRCG